ncbi:uncharacterized protein LOC119330812 [Triticum dicoccoides]|uniref:uncharacterized protein LOC119330812 n=1 Tax=Triticum dicoccoides TaxID=85692 RepID=UPI001891C8C1|nr:uncharacterized protein LOC119330812 [Triticum dicoccoides]
MTDPTGSSSTSVPRACPPVGSSYTSHCRASRSRIRQDPPPLSSHAFLEMDTAGSCCSSFLYGGVELSALPYEPPAPLSFPSSSSPRKLPPARSSACPSSAARVQFAQQWRAVRRTMACSSATFPGVQCHQRAVQLAPACSAARPGVQCSPSMHAGTLTCNSTLTDSLVAAAGIIAQEVAGDVRMTDTSIWQG